jgi:hypothetical protein
MAEEEVNYEFGGGGQMGNSDGGGSGGRRRCERNSAVMTDHSKRGTARPELLSAPNFELIQTRINLLIHQQQHILVRANRGNQH